MDRIYNAGIYCRLSKDDDRPGESMSIETQRAMLTEYCEKNGYNIYGEYVDDGFTGTNFERDAFQRLLNDIDAGAVNMVLTKDLSRLGRDYIQMGYFTEIYFPAKGVRYIALNDGFDSEKSVNDIAPFMNILNDMYARDISRKVKAAKLQRAKKGLFIAGEAPYGYKNVSGRLEPDPEAAKIVLLIFELAAEGLGEVRIAQELQSRGILSPSSYKANKGLSGGSHGRKTENPCVWSFHSIGAMLRNRVYRKAVDKLTELLIAEGALHAVRLKQKSKTKHKKKIAAAIYEYQADCDGEWGEISFDFENGTAEILRLADWDTMKTNRFANKAIAYLLNCENEKLPTETIFAFES